MGLESLLANNYITFGVRPLVRTLFYTPPYLSSPLCATFIHSSISLISGFRYTPCCGV